MTFHFLVSFLLFLGIPVQAGPCFKIQHWGSAALFGQNRTPVFYRDFPSLIPNAADTALLWSPFYSSGLRVYSAPRVYISKLSEQNAPYGPELFLGALDHTRFQNRQVLVLGSGSGHLAFLAWQAGARFVMGLEISESAYSLSIKNRDALGLSKRQVHFLRSDLFYSIERTKPIPRFDIILFNAPRPVNRDLLLQSNPSLKSNLSGYDLFNLMKTASYSPHLFDVPAHLFQRYMSEAHKYLKDDGSFFLMSDTGVEDYFSSFSNLSGLAIRGPWRWNEESSHGDSAQFAIFQFRRTDKP